MKRAHDVISLLLLAGCADLGSTETVSGSTPITGLKLPAEEIVSVGGCGTSATQVFKYAVYVSNEDAFRVAGLYDCFTDAYFVNLPAAGSGSTAYGVQVLAFNRAAFDAQAGALAPSVATGDPAGLTASWRFTCKATQQFEAQVIVRCERDAPAATP